MKKRAFLVFLAIGIIISCAHVDIPNTAARVEPPGVADQKTIAENSWIEGEWAVRLESKGADNVVYFREDFVYQIVYINGVLFPVRLRGRTLIRRIVLMDDKTVGLEIFGKTYTFYVKNNDLIEGSYTGIYYLNTWPRENRITMMRKK